MPLLLEISHSMLHRKQRTGHCLCEVHAYKRACVVASFLPPPLLRSLAIRDAQFWQSGVDVDRGGELALLDCDMHQVLDRASLYTYTVHTSHSASLARN
jgi:hypothetical protein